MTNYSTQPKLQRNKITIKQQFNNRPTTSSPSLSSSASPSQRIHHHKGCSIDHNVSFNSFSI